MTLQQIIDLQREFDQAHRGSIPFYSRIGPKNVSDLEHLIVAVVGELGEFANITKKIRRGDLAYDSGFQALSEELADVFIYIIKIAGQMGVDLEKQYIAKMKKNTRRFKRFSGASIQRK